MLRCFINFGARFPYKMYQKNEKLKKNRIELLGLEAVSLVRQQPYRLPVRQRLKRFRLQLLQRFLNLQKKIPQQNLMVGNK